MAQTRTIVAVDPATGARLTRRTARTYVAVVVTGDPAQGQAWPQNWAGRPDLAAKQLAKWGPGSTARLAPVVEDPWAEAEPAPAVVAEPEADAAVAHLCRKFPISTPATWAPAVDRLRARGAVATVGAILRETERPAPAPALPGEARPGAAAPDARPVLPGETEPPAPVAQDGPAPVLPNLAGCARALASDLATPAPTPDSLRARAAVRGAEAERLGDAEPARAQVAADHAQTLTAWADSLSPAPVADAWAGQPWDPGTPEARARVALQGERVATLWPIAQAVRGAGFELPPVWWADGPILAGERTYGEALAALPLGAIAAAAAALAALPPVTAAQARALRLCRGEAVGV